MGSKRRLEKRVAELERRLEVLVGIVAKHAGEFVGVSRELAAIERAALRQDRVIADWLEALDEG